MSNRRLLPPLEIASQPYSRARLIERGFEQALHQALATPMSDVIATVSAAGIMGRGGAAFPTGQKWASVQRESSTIKYVVMNADESEPGTFKDRVLLEQDPLGALTGLIIAAHAVGASYGYIYIRGEYRDIETTLNKALKTLEEAGFLGSSSLRLEIRRGAGAYIAGEETALFNSIEGKRPEPRVKPPFPTTHGLFGKPTLIQNVETLANVAVLFAHDPTWFKARGTPKTPGTKLVALSGHIQNPGVYEVAFGVPLSTILYDASYGGGIGGTGRLGSVLLGGAAGTFLTPDEIHDLSYDYEPLRALGASIGSGALMVLDDHVDLHQVLKQLARFFAEESCGQCVPCRVGSQRLFELLDKPLASQNLTQLKDLGHAMRDASICGLGQTAPLALLSLLDRPMLWPTERNDTVHG